MSLLEFKHTLCKDNNSVWQKIIRKYILIKQVPTYHQMIFQKTVDLCGTDVSFKAHKSDRREGVLIQLKASHFSKILLEILVNASGFLCAFQFFFWCASKGDNARTKTQPIRVRL